MTLFPPRIRWGLVALTAAATVLSAVPSQALATGEDSFISGSIASEGKANHAGNLSVYAYPVSADSSGMMRGVLISESRVDNRGRFSLGLGGVDLAPFTFEDGTMMVQVVGKSGERVVNEMFNMTQEADGTWVDPDSQVPLDLVTFETQEDVSFSPTHGEKLTAAAQCTGGYGWALTSNKRYANIPLQSYKTLSNINFKYEWETTKSTKLEILNRTPSSGAASASGALAFSSQNTTSAGIAAPWSYNVNKTLKVEWEYREWTEQCFLSNNIITPTGRTQWRPYQFAGGNSMTNNTQDFTCATTNRSSFDVTTWVSRTATTTWNGEFSIHGVSLKAATTNSSTAKLTLIPRSGKTATACGSNDKPIHAQRVKEV